MSKGRGEWLSDGHRKGTPSGAPWRPRFLFHFWTSVRPEAGLGCPKGRGEWLWGGHGKGTPSGGPWRPGSFLTFGRPYSLRLLGCPKVAATGCRAATEKALRQMVRGRPPAPSAVGIQPQMDRQHQTSARDDRTQGAGWSPPNHDRPQPPAHEEPNR